MKEKRPLFVIVAAFGLFAPLLVRAESEKGLFSCSRLLSRIEVTVQGFFKRETDAERLARLLSSVPDLTLGRPTARWSHAHERTFRDVYCGNDIPVTIGRYKKGVMATHVRLITGCHFVVDLKRNEIAVLDEYGDYAGRVAFLSEIDSSLFPVKIDKILRSAREILSEKYLNQNDRTEAFIDLTQKTQKHAQALRAYKAELIDIAVAAENFEFIPWLESL